ncbi:unnamed protein product, partial [Amoebophrya sp. A25]
ISTGRPIQSTSISKIYSPRDLPRKARFRDTPYLLPFALSTIEDAMEAAQSPTKAQQVYDAIISGGLYWLQIPTKTLILWAVHLHQSQKRSRLQRQRQHSNSSSSSSLLDDLLSPTLCA